MIWYNYFFLTRGKPVTHLEALNNIPDDRLKDNTPDIFKKMGDKIKTLLNIKD